MRPANLLSQAFGICISTSKVRQTSVNSTSTSPMAYLGFAIWADPPKKFWKRVTGSSGEISLDRGYLHVGPSSTVRTPQIRQSQSPYTMRKTRERRCNRSRRCTPIVSKCTTEFLSMLTLQLQTNPKSWTASCRPCSGPNSCSRCYECRSAQHRAPGCFSRRLYRGRRSHELAEERKRLCRSHANEEFFFDSGVDRQEGKLPS